MKFDIYTQNYRDIAASINIENTTEKMDEIERLKKYSSKTYTKDTYELTMTVKFEVNQYKDKTYLELITSDIKHRIAEVDNPTEEEIADLILKNTRIGNLSMQDS